VIKLLANMALEIKAEETTLKNPKTLTIRRTRVWMETLGIRRSTGSFNLKTPLK